MLSDKDILAAIKKKELKVEPFNKECVRTNILQLHLGTLFYFPKARKVSLSDESFEKAFKMKEIAQDGHVDLHPHECILGETAEFVGVSPKLGMMLDGTSTLARLGVSVAKSMTIETGHGWPAPRKITLELSNESPFTLRLKPGDYVAKGIFWKLGTPSTKGYDSIGKYGAQKRAGIPKKVSGGE